jgi:8-oxo-dGTP diphosphatase
VKEFPTIIPVVAAALLSNSGRVLLQQRKADRGGKAEPGESLDLALRREIAEELGIALDPAALEPLSFAARPDDPHVVLLYTCRAWTGELQCLDAATLGWFTGAELAALPLVPLDVPLARALRGLLEPGN